MRAVHAHTMASTSSSFTGLMLMMLVILPDSKGACPRPCACYAPAEVHCTFRSLVSVPAGISSRVQRINLGFNTINHITDVSFSGLRKLDLLMMHGNNVQKIPDGAFQDLLSLQILKMSYNKLKIITGHTLSGLTALIRLHLDHNRIEFIHPDAFSGMTSLRLLHLEGNYLQKLHPATFSTFSLFQSFHVSTLKYLYLSDNLLNTLSRRMLENMPQLENIFLYGNPWSCDCRMSWMQDWRSSGVMKCKKDRSLADGQLCPRCSSPKHLMGKDISNVKDFICSGPAISSSEQHVISHEENITELLPIDRINTPFGNLSLSLSDEHGTKADLFCQILELRDSTKISWNYTRSHQIAANMTLFFDVECSVDRESYEGLWRLLAYYSEVPVHLRREITLTKDPEISYRYRQDIEKDVFYYTGVQASVLTRPSWLMQPFMNIRLNRPYSSSKSVRLILNTHVSTTADEEVIRQQKRSWVMIERDNKTQTTFSSIVGGLIEMTCIVLSSEDAVIQWMLPDGSRIKASSSSSHNRVTVSNTGKLHIKSVDHSDAGVYYCIAEVVGDIDIVPFRLMVVDSSTPLQGEEIGSALTRFVGESAALPCVSAAAPDAVLNWIFPDGSILNSRANSSRAFISSNGTLFIPYSQLDNNGYHKCVAMNEHGADVMATKLTVLRKKGIQPLRPYPSKPQSAAGVSTRVKAFLEDVEEASGDDSNIQEQELPNRSFINRRRGPNTTTRGRSFGHGRHRRPFRKDVRGQQNKTPFESQRNVHTKNKIDPQKWADILAKIREKTSPKNTSIHTSNQPMKHIQTEDSEEHSGLIDNTEGSSPDKHTYDTQTVQITAHTEEENKNIKHTTPEVNTSADKVIYITSTQSVSNYMITEINVAEERHVGTISVENDQIHLKPVINPQSERENKLNISKTAAFDSDSPLLTTTSTSTIGPESPPARNHLNSKRRFGSRWRIKMKRPFSKWTTSRPRSTSKSVILTMNQTSQTGATALIFPTISSEPLHPTPKNTAQIYPTNPTEPDQPSSETTAQIYPTSPTEPDQPSSETTAQIYPTNPTDPDQPSSETTAQIYPTNPTEPDQPSSETTAQIYPTNPTEPDQPFSETTAQIYPTNPTDPDQPSSETTAQIYPTNPTEPDQPSSETTAQIYPTSPTEPDQPSSETTAQIYPTNPTEPDQPSSETTAQIYPTNPTDPDQPSSETTAQIYPTNPTEPDQPSSETTAQIYPTSPTEPDQPSSETTAQIYPTNPTEPDQPSSETTAQIYPTNPTEPDQPSSETTAQIYPTSPTEPDQPSSETTAQIYPTNPTEPDQPSSETTAQIYPTNPMEPDQPSSETTAQIYPTNPTEPDQPSSETTAQIYPTNPTEPDQPSSETTAQIYPTNPTEPDQPSSETTAQIYPTNPTEPDQPSSETTAQIYPTNPTEPDQPSSETTAQIYPTNPTEPDQPSSETTAQIYPTNPTEPDQPSSETTAQIYPTNPTDPDQPSSETTAQIYPTSPTEPDQPSSETTAQIYPTNPTEPDQPSSETTAQIYPTNPTQPDQPSSETTAQIYPTNPTEITANVYHTHLTEPVYPSSRNTGHTYPSEPNEPVYSSTGDTNLYSTISIGSDRPNPKTTACINTTVPTEDTAVYPTSGAAVHIHPTVQMTLTDENTVKDKDPSLKEKDDRRVAFAEEKMDENTAVTDEDQTSPPVISLTESSNESSPDVLPELHSDVLEENNVWNITSSRDNLTSKEGSVITSGEPLQENPKLEPAENFKDESVHNQVSFPLTTEAFTKHITSVERQTESENNEIFILKNQREQSIMIVPEASTDSSFIITASMIFIKTTQPPSVDLPTTTTSSPTSTNTPANQLTPAHPLHDNRIPFNSRDPETNYIEARKYEGISSTNNRYPSYYSRNPSSVDLNSVRNIQPTAAAESSAPSSSSSIITRSSLKISQTGSVQQMRPRINTGKLHTLTVNAGSYIQIPCDSVGDPVPVVSWTKRSTGAVMSANSRIQRFEVQSNGTLVIHSVQLQDRGQYLCIARNVFGSDKMMVTLVVLAHVPRVTLPRHQDLTVYLGSSAAMDCHARGLPAPNISWVLPDRSVMRTVSESERRVMLFNNGTLRIKHTNYHDRGVYKCIASNAAGADVLSVKLHVSALPPMIHQPGRENRTVPDDQAVFIHCTSEGSPSPAVRWVTFTGTQIRPSQFINGNLFVFPNGTLYIPKPTEKDSGSYECVAVNSVGLATRTVSLHVKGNSSLAKIISSSSQNTHVQYGGLLSLNCTATGNPNPRIIWRTPAKKLIDADYRFDGRMKVFSNGSLAISPVTERDEGDYLCVARNKMGNDYLLLTVKVMMKAAQIQHKLLNNHKVAYGGELKVDCIASGLPDPKIAWSLPDGTMINRMLWSDDSAGRNKRYVLFDNGTLYFNEVGMREEGDYTCYAQNRMGTDEMKVHIKVVADVPVVQNNVYSVIRVPHGETAVLPCSAKGKPVPTITWTSPSNRIISPVSDKHQVSSNGTLHIHKIQRFDTGNYTCSARNIMGMDRKVIHVEVLIDAPVINGLKESWSSIRRTVFRHRRVLLDCRSEGNPVPQIIWVLPNNTRLSVPYYGSRMTVHHNASLDIRAVRTSDSGVFLCVARNEGGEAKLQIHLDVTEETEKPRLRDLPVEHMSLTDGVSVTLNCSVDGRPAPEITWILPDGTPLLRGTSVFRFYHKLDGTLLIGEPEAGRYRCVGRNSAGYVERIVTLELGRKPDILNKYSSLVSIINGENLQLNCQSSGNPQPEQTWTLPNGVVLTRPQQTGRYSVASNGTLTVERASVYDRGTYVCQTTNPHGSSSLTVSVIVIAYPPRITSGPAAVTYARPGVALQLHCLALATPKAEVIWETPDGIQFKVSVQPRLYGNKYLHPQGSLTIQSPSKHDNGLYKCTAKNVVGTDSRSTYVYVF